MRDRSLLHLRHLPSFTEWAQEQGWVVEPNKDLYEVLRLRRGKEIAIVHRKDMAKEHLTVWGTSERLARLFVNKLRAERRDLVNG